jgi:hypothetical protein
VQDRSSGGIEWLTVVTQAAGDLAVVEEPRSWSERVAVVSGQRVTKMSKNVTVSPAVRPLFAALMVR